MKRYRVEKVNGEMVVTADRKGNYCAASSEEIRRVLTELNFQTTTAEVKIGKLWRPLRRTEKRKTPSSFSEPEPIKPLCRKLRILKALHLYKDPLETLIYRDK